MYLNTSFCLFFIILNLKFNSFIIIDILYTKLKIMYTCKYICVCIHAYNMAKHDKQDAVRFNVQDNRSYYH